MAGFIDVGAAPLGSLKDALAADAPVRVCMHEGGAPLTPARRLWPPDHVDLDEPPPPSATAEDVCICVIPNADLAGPGVSPMRGEDFIGGAGFSPSYVGAFIADDVDPDRWRPAPGAEVVSVETAFSLVHYNLIYGHWLLEMFPKLFIIRDLIRAGVTGEIVLAMNTPRYVLEYIDLIAPGAPIRWFDPERQRVRARRLICPGMFNSHYHYHPALGAALDALIAQCRSDGGARGRRAGWLSRLIRPRAARTDTAKALFVSRRRMPPSYRVMTNRLEIEAAARRLGLTVVHPEQLGVADQIDLFSRAGLVVGEFGSGMHNALFSPPGTEVVCLNWISEVQSRLGDLRGHAIGYILPTDGRPRTYTLGDTPKEFTIDRALFEQRVGALMSKAAA